MPPPQPPPIQKIGLLVGQNVSAKMQRKILSDQYLELAVLLPQNQVEEGTYDLKFSKQGLQIVKPGGRKYLSLEQWNEAFAVYMAIYIRKADTADSAHLLLQQLLTYQRDIGNLARQGLAWYDYDRQFRSDRATTFYPFGTVRQDLMLSAMLSKSEREHKYNQPRPRQNQPFRTYGTGPQHRTQSAASSRAAGYCFAYHEQGKRCIRQPCQFKHTCPECSAHHPVYLCAKQKQPAGNSAATAAAIPSAQPHTRTTTVYPGKAGKAPGTSA